jgi:hypothetical protein
MKDPGPDRTARSELDDLRASAVKIASARLSEYSALCTKCLVVALAGCSLSVTANVRTKGRRPLVLACAIVTKLSASHRGLRTSEGVDLWPLHAMSIAVEASTADVPDNRPLSVVSPAGRLFPETNGSQRIGRGSVGLWATMSAPAAVMMTSL